MSKYNTIFFDLDHTLWDFEKNSQEALREIFHNYQFDVQGLEFEFFFEKYKAINHNYWEKYRNNKVTKEELRIGRFTETFSAFNLNIPPVAKKFADDYVRISPTKKNLFNGAKEALLYLKNKNYKLAIITNGFEEVQITKINSCGIAHFFDAVITSENVGVRKPHKKIFLHALKRVCSMNNESIMIGDDVESDMLGAKNSKIDQIYFNPKKTKHNHRFTYEINSLTEIKKIL